VISLKLNDANKLFKVSTMVYSQVTVNALEDYNYKLTDMSGRIMQNGKGKSGINNINISNNPNGVYLIQIISNTQRLTERIVKL
jgi:hypothetical protein